MTRTVRVFIPVAIIDFLLGFIGFDVAYDQPFDRWLTGAFWVVLVVLYVIAGFGVREIRRDMRRQP